MKNNKLVRRGFLNVGEGMATYFVDLDNRFGGTVSLSDCSRIINLEFDVHTYSKPARRKILKERIKKAQLLAELFSEVADYLKDNTESLMSRADD